MAEIVSSFINPENRQWAEAAANGQLLIKACNRCGRHHYYPRAHCPFCGSLDTEFRAACGRGTIYTFTPNRISRTPLINAYVTLEEGPTIMTRIVGAAPEEVAIGQPVVLSFQESAMGFPVPVFSLAEQA